MSEDLIYVDKQVVSSIVQEVNNAPTTRFPTRLQEIWNDYDLITDNPSFVSFNDGSKDINNVVQLYKNRSLTQSLYNKDIFILSTDPIELTNIVFNKETISDSSLLNVLNKSPSQPDGYNPIITDSKGNKFKMSSKWIIDGLMNYVYFLNGIPLT